MIPPATLAVENILLPIAIYLLFGGDKTIVFKCREEKKKRFSSDFYHQKLKNAADQQDWLANAHQVQLPVDQLASDNLWADSPDTVLKERR